MKTKSFRSIVFAVLFMFLSGLYTLSSAQSGGGEVKLAYSYPAGPGVNYMVSTVQAQVMDIQGQTMQTDVLSAFGCTIKGAGIQDGNLKLEILVDTLGQTSMSPMGGSGGAVSDIKGKTCSIIVSPDGKIIDISGAEALTYYLDGAGELNLGQAVSDFFPRLPGKPVKAGDTWSVVDSVTTKSPSNTMKNVYQSEYKLESVETDGGVETARISVTNSGTMTMAISAQGMDIYLKGPYTGTADFTFAVKEGYFLKQTSVTKLAGDLDIPSMSMTMPLTMEMKTVSEKK